MPSRRAHQYDSGPLASSSHPYISRLRSPTPLLPPATTQRDCHFVGHDRPDDAVYGEMR
jgi:hypothetical protein